MAFGEPREFIVRRGEASVKQHTAVAAALLQALFQEYAGQTSADDVVGHSFINMPPVFFIPYVRGTETPDPTYYVVLTRTVTKQSMVSS